MRKDIQWNLDDDGKISRRIPLNDEMQQVLDAQFRSFEQRHGRPPGPNDRIFDNAPSGEVIEHYTVQAMEKAQLNPALIFAYQATRGLMVNPKNEHLIPVKDMEDWNAAIDEYDAKHGTTTTQRIFSDDDLNRIMQFVPGGEDDSGDSGVRELPISPPISKEAWNRLKASEAMDDPVVMKYFTDCIAAVHRSDRWQGYAKFLTILAYTDNLPDSEREYDRLFAKASKKPMTAKMLERALNGVLAATEPGGGLPSAASAFELLAFAGDFLEHTAEKIGKTEHAEELLTVVRSMTLMTFVVAVNAELGNVAIESWATPKEE